MLDIAVTTLVSLAMGLVVAAVYRFRNEYSQSLSRTLVILPALVQIIIMLASGNIGVGIAVAGAFSLIRFRSIAGNARDISHLFFAMSIGFVTGLGYLLYALVFLLLIGGASLLMTLFRYGQPEGNIHNLRIKIPENLNYEGVFDEIFARYTDSYQLEGIKTTQMGSLYELSYTLRLKDAAKTKEFIDELRVRNGNLSIMLNRGKLDKYEL